MEDTFDDQNEEIVELDTEELDSLVKSGPKAPDEPKKKARKVKEKKLQTSEYSKHSFTDNETSEASNLMDNLTSFLSKEAKINPGSGVNSTVPSGIDLLDCLLGGGFCTSLSQVVGLPGSGKSSLAARAIATGQRKWPGKFIGVYIDSEESATTERLAELGITCPKIKPYRENTVEIVFRIIESICAFKDKNPELVDYPSIIVWDSIANTLPEKAMTDASHHSTVGLKAAMLAFLLPRYTEKLNKYNIALIGINQLRDKIEMGVMPTAPDLRFLPHNKIPGGQSLNYNTIQLVWCRQAAQMKEDSYGFKGIKVLCKTIKNKLFTPNIEFNLVFTFKNGFSNFWTNYELLKDHNRLSASAGWVKLEGYDNKTSKFRVKDTQKKYKEDEEFKKAWNKNVNDVIKCEYLDKYKPEDLIDMETS